MASSYNESFWSPAQQAFIPLQKAMNYVKWISCFCTPSFLALEHNSFASTPLCIRRNLRTFTIFQAKLRTCLNLLLAIFLIITFSTELHTKRRSRREHLIVVLYLSFNVCYVYPIMVTCKGWVSKNGFSKITSRLNILLARREQKG